VRPPELTEDEQIKETVRQLLELLQQFGNQPAKVIPWPKVDKGRPRSQPRRIIAEANDDATGCGRDVLRAASDPAHS
jgi:hypothetical protein